MKKYITCLLFSAALTSCGGSNSESVNEQPVTAPPPNNPAQGTVLEESCNGTTLVQTVADGSGGSTQQETPNSEQCGYEPPVAFGTPVGDPYCATNLAQDRFTQLLETITHFRDVDKLQDYADGEGGTYTERVDHLSQDCFVQMEAPPDCPTDASSTGDARYNYMTCDGIKQLSSVSYPYEEGFEGWAIMDILVVFDTNITEAERDGMTVEDFVNKQFFDANHMYDVSNTGVRLRVADIVMVDVANGDLYRQYNAFFNSRYEFNELDTWQKQAGADFAFLFKTRYSQPVACGVANLDATKGIEKSRGIIQCFHNSVFQENASTRYYNRAHETFAHEVGHLLGLQHEWEDARAPGLFEYSYGYNLPGYNPQKDNPNYQGIYGGYGTIMTYADLATGRFSDRSVTCTFPEEAGEYAGQSVRFGTDGGCFCLEPIENQPPPTDSVDSLRRTRYLMSQLHELEHNIQSSSSIDFSIEDDPVWSIWTNVPTDICFF